jgi:hypothetical protein
MFMLHFRVRSCVLFLFARAVAFDLHLMQSMPVYSVCIDALFSCACLTRAEKLVEW